jgi:cyclopropane fatty-acyl-phospholipid synthase-like methyltransferase
MESIASLLKASGDPMGAAIYEYHKFGHASTLVVRSSMFDDDEIPVADLFREFTQMPALERAALQLAEGKILDVGAGAGCHSLALMNMGKTVTAVDISALSVAVMKERGIDARQVNFYDKNFTEKYDTVLMLMNGTGIMGNLDHVKEFFDALKRLLAPGGKVLIDSSDLRYLFEEEDGSLMIDLAGDYYGQLDYQMQYKDVEGDPFDWLYLDFNTLAYYAEENGFKAEVVAEGEHYDYLACLTLA